MKQQFSGNKKSVLLCTIFLLLSFTAQSQTNSSVSVGVASNPMDPIIVTATRTPTKASDVLADNVIIGPEEIQQAAQTTLVELLQRQRGVEISSYGGGGAPASVFLRGTNNAQSLVLIDGVRIESALFGGATWSTIPLQLIDHIEIIYGPQSSLYGADAMGGVVQIFTKKGNGPLQFSASTGYGTYGTSISDVSLYGSTQGDQNIRYSLGASQETSQGFNAIANNNFYKQNGFPYPAPQNTGYTKSSGTGNISQEWSRGQEIGMQFLVSRLKNQAQISDYIDDFHPNIPFISTDISNLNTFAAFSKNQITDNWKSLFQIAQSEDLGQGSYFYSNPSTKTNQTIYTWQNDIAIGKDLLQLLAERREQKISAQFISIDPNTWYGVFPSNLTQTRNTNSLAASYQLKKENQLANLAIRNDSISGYTPQTTGSISYGYFFTKQWRANANYGTGFKPPSIYELYYPNYGNINLLPEKSKNTEIGLHYEGVLSDTHLVAYNNTISNLIQTTYNASGSCVNPSVNGCATNYGAVKISGISLGNTTRIQNFSIKGSIDQQNPIIQTDSVNSAGAVVTQAGTVLPKRARLFGNAALEYQQGKITFGGGGTFSGQRYDPARVGNYITYAPASTSGNMGGYAIFNLYANYDLDKDWGLFARWNNIFNKDYQLSYGYNTPGSNVFVGLRYSMK
jgi:vitamin B12 transporter